MVFKEVTNKNSIVSEDNINSRKHEKKNTVTKTKNTPTLNEVMITIFSFNNLHDNSIIRKEINEKMIKLEKLLHEWLQSLPDTMDEIKLKENIFKLAIHKFAVDTAFLHFVNASLPKFPLLKENYDKKPIEKVLGEVNKAIEKTTNSFAYFLRDIDILSDNEKSWNEIVKVFSVYNKLYENSIANAISIIYTKKWPSVFEIIEGNKTDVMNEKDMKNLFFDVILPNLREHLLISVPTLLNYRYTTRFKEKMMEGNELPGQIFRLGAIFLVRAYEYKLRGLSNEEIKKKISVEIKKIIKRPEMYEQPYFMPFSSFSLDDYVDKVLNEEKSSMDVSYFREGILNIRSAYDVSFLDSEFIFSYFPKLDKLIKQDAVFNNFIVDILKNGRNEIHSKEIETALRIFWYNQLKKYISFGKIPLFPDELRHDLKKNGISVEDIRNYSLFNGLRFDRGWLSNWEPRNIIPNLLDLDSHDFKIILPGIDTEEPFEAYTDGEKIYITPFYNVLPNSVLNRIILLSLIIHETRHIKYGSFNFINECPINLLDYIPQILELNKDYQGKEKELQEDFKLINKAIKEVFNYVYNEINKFEREGSNRANFLKLLIDEINKKIKTIKGEFRVLNEENVNLILIMLSNEISSIHNIIEDYRIDHAFIFDNDLKDDFLQFESEEKREMMKMGYIVGGYFLLRKSLMHWLFSKEKENFENLTNLLLVYTQMDEVFNAIADEEIKDDNRLKSLLKLMDTIKEHAFPIKDYKTKIKNYMNESLVATIEFIFVASLIAKDSRELTEKLKQAVKNAKMCNNGSCNSNNTSQSEGSNKQNNGSSSGSSQSEENDNKEGNSSSSNTSQSEGSNKENNGSSSGSSQSEENDNKEDKEKSGSPKESKLDEAEREDKTKDFPINDLKEGGIVRPIEKYPENNRGNHKNMKGGKSSKTGEINVKQTIKFTVSKGVIDYYKEIFKKFKLGTIKTEYVPSKRSGRLNPKKLARLMENGREPQQFLDKKKVNINNQLGNDLYQRPLDIYIAIDKSGSMTSAPHLSNSMIVKAYHKSGLPIERKYWALFNAIAMLVAYKELIKDNPNIKDDITIKLMGVSDAGEYSIIDIEDVNFKKQNNYEVIVPNVVEEGGGTDLVEMIKKAGEIVKTTEKNVAIDIFKRKRHIAINPSILFLFFTDFGDFGDRIEKIKDELRSLNDISKTYRKDSKLINKIPISDTTIGVVFPCPDKESDSEHIFEATKEILEIPTIENKLHEEEVSGAFSMLKGDELGKVLELLVEWMKSNPKQSSNIKKD